MPRASSRAGSVRPIASSGSLEQLQVPLAEVRGYFGSPGLERRSRAKLSRQGDDEDGARAQRVCRAPVIVWRPPRRRRAPSSREVGLPVVVKPPAGAGRGQYFPARRCRRNSSATSSAIRRRTSGPCSRRIPARRGILLRRGAHRRAAWSGIRSRVTGRHRSRSSRIRGFSGVCCCRAKSIRRSSRIFAASASRRCARSGSRPA